MRLTRRKLAAGVLGVAILAAVGYAMRPKPIEVETARARQGTMRVTVDAEGRTTVRDRYVITAPVTGRLERVELREGEAVEPGRVVAWIAPLPLDPQTRQQASARLAAAQAIEREAAVGVERARSAEDHAARTARRREALLAAGAVSQEQRDDAVLAHRVRRDELAAAEARARAAAADVDAARAALIALRGGPQAAVAVRSPCSGSVLRVPERSERVLTAGAPILELGDPRALEVVVDVLSSDAVRLTPSDQVEIIDWGGAGVLRGRVYAIEPSAFTRVSALGVDEQRVNVRIELIDPPAALGDGFRVEARITVWEGRDVLTVPASALFQPDAGWAVYVVDDGRARTQAVEVGHRTGATAEIVRGLGAGTEVVLFPSDQLGDGVRVKHIAAR